MINFSQYPNITKLEIQNDIQLLSTDFSEAFKGFSNLKAAELNHTNIVNMYMT